ncbi:DUF488 domain-containing protein [Sphaerisporangium aureirubrum]|uniref:DUF488 domain-containing protein n=1 Tax=Sphaerisporangium aureirubrum TaxID=1544736 RepID=A0ABW1NE70_9ACTN
MPWQIKRVYDSPSPADGYRVLVDRLWPRGMTKEEAALDLWLKEIAPTPTLRTWFAHRPDRFEEFTKRYTAELTTNPALGQLLQLAQDHPAITLLYAAKSTTVNHAAVLAEYLTSASR